MKPAPLPARSRSRTGRAAPPLWERLAAAGALAFFVTGASALLRAQGYTPATMAAGNALASLIQNGVFAVVFGLAVWQITPVLRAAWRGALVWALVALALLSIAWSVAPGTTLRRGYALAATTLFGTYLAARYPAREQLALLRWVCIGVLLVSAALAVGWTRVGQDQEVHRGAWIGLFPSKNPLGRFAALSMLCLVLAARARIGWRWVTWGAVGLAGGVLLLSSSKTSLVLAFVVMLLPFWGRVLRMPPVPAFTLSLTAAALAAAVGSWAAANSELILTSLGRDATLTGRTSIWPVAILAAMRRFWLGYGYNVFWVERASGVAMVWRLAGWEAVHAHNGLIELWLDVGMVGVVLALAGLAIALGRAIGMAHRGRDPSSTWPLAFLVFLCISNVTEAAFLGHNSVYWVLYVAIVATVAAPDRGPPGGPGGRSAPPPRARLPRRAAAGVGDLRPRPG